MTINLDPPPRDDRSLREKFGMPDRGQKLVPSAAPPLPTRPTVAPPACENLIREEVLADRVEALERWRGEVESHMDAERGAGRDLAYAIYHAGAEFALSMPPSVARAYVRAQQVMKIGRQTG